MIVSWNCEAALRRCLQALESSEGRDEFEVIVVDKASRDGCAQLDVEHPAVTMLRLPRNFGQTRARNIGIRTAQTDVIVILSPFVALAPGAMKAVNAWFEANPHAAAGAIDLGAETDRLFVPGVAELTALCDPAKVGDFAKALVVRRGFLQGMNYFDEKRFSEFWHELELYWQLRNAGKDVQRIPGATGEWQAPAYSVALDGEALDMIYADRASAAGAYLGKHGGMMTGLGFQLGRVFGNLMSPRRALSVLGGTRIDGTQGGVLG